MPSPSVDIIWQEIRVLKSRVCELEQDVSVEAASSMPSVPQILQFIVGDPSSYLYTKNLSDVDIPSDNNSTLTIHDNVVMDTVLVFLDGQSLPMSRIDRESYVVGYDVGLFEVTKSNFFPFLNHQLYEIRYQSV